MLGLSGTLIGLIWGFTQFTARVREASDLEITLFLEESSKVIRWLLYSCGIFSFNSVILVIFMFIPNLNIALPYIGMIDLIFVLIILSVVLFIAGCYLVTYVLLKVGRSIINLSRWR
jgi:hypothetical protein